MELKWRKLHDKFCYLTTTIYFKLNYAFISGYMNECFHSPIRCYIPLRVNRNCLSLGKYGFTFASSPDALQLTKHIYITKLGKYLLTKPHQQLDCMATINLIQPEQEVRKIRTSVYNRSNPLEGQLN